MRFWAYVNGGAVRLALAEGQTLRHATGGPTDEGWEWRANQWQIDGEAVLWEFATDGIDCDGRLATCVVCRCAIDALAAGFCHPQSDLNDVPWPAWERVSATQRDYQAKAAGY